MKEALSGILGEGTANIVLFILLFAVILAAIVIIYNIMKRVSAQSSGRVDYKNHRHDPSSRLSVVDAAIVDDQRKLVLVRRDDVEHLILIGGPTDVVVEQNIINHHDFAQSKGITEAQIARYQETDPNGYEEEFNYPTQPQAVTNASSTTLALNKAPMSSFEVQSDINERSRAHATNNQYTERKPARDHLTTDNSDQFVATKSDINISATPSTAGSAAPSAPLVERPAPAAVFTAPPAKPAIQQTRPVVPSSPAHNTTTKPVVRSHPAYPLSQVSHGVLTSTSAAAAAAVTTSAISGRIDSVAPQKSTSLDDVKPNEIATSNQQAEFKPEPSFEPEMSSASNDFASLDAALDQALFNDLNSAFKETANSDSFSLEEEIDFTFEEELLSSLDINVDGDLNIDIEDEMDKLLGELSINPER